MFLKAVGKKFLERLQNPEIYARVKQAVIKSRLSSNRGIDKLETIYIASSRKFPEYEGKNIEDRYSSFRGGQPRWKMALT